MRTTKTILMKTVCKLSFAFLLLLAGMAFTIKPVADTSYCSTASNSSQIAISEKTIAGVDDPAWLFLTISGVWQESNIGYYTDPIYYAGYKNCNNQKREIFIREAKIAFNKYLKKYYPNEFPDGSLRISANEYNGIIAKAGDFMLTEKEAWTRITAWKKEEEGHGYRVGWCRYFYFTCKDL